MDRWKPREWRDRDEHYNEEREERFYRGGHDRPQQDYRGGQDYGGTGSDRGYRADRSYGGAEPYRGADPYRGGEPSRGDQYGSYGGYNAYERGQARGSDRGFAQDYRDRNAYGRPDPDRHSAYFDRGNIDRGTYDRGTYDAPRIERPTYRPTGYRPASGARDERDFMNRERMRTDAGPAWGRTFGDGFEFDRADVDRDGWRGRGSGERDQRDREYGRDYWDDYPWSSRRW
ncbi:MAG TPA: hypothetical protein VGF48_14540 [Thermoanaerobaculia bacterium]